MKIRVLGCSAIERTNAKMSSFLVDGKLLLDAGTIGTVLNDRQQSRIENILLTHAHLDHIKDLPFFADYIVQSGSSQRITVFSIPEVIDALSRHLFNDILWPDFTKIPSAEDPIIHFHAINAGEPFNVGGYRITAYRVNHSSSAVGFLVEDEKGTRLMYLGDSGPNASLWKHLNGTRLNGVIIEASMPDALKDLALKSGHLTPAMLLSEIEKMDKKPDMLYITHSKPVHRDRIHEEVTGLNVSNIRILEDGQLIEL